MPPQAITLYFFLSFSRVSIHPTNKKNSDYQRCKKCQAGRKKPSLSIFAQRFTTQHDFLFSFLFVSLRGEHVATSLWDLSLKKSGFVCKSVIRNGKHPHIGHFIFILERASFIRLGTFFDFLVISWSLAIWKTELRKHPAVS